MSSYLHMPGSNQSSLLNSSQGVGPIMIIGYIYRCLIIWAQLKNMLTFVCKQAKTSLEAQVMRITCARPTDLIDLQRGSNMWCKMGWTVDVDDEEVEGGSGVDLENRKVGAVDNFYEEFFNWTSWPSFTKITKNTRSFFGHSWIYFLG